MLVPLLSTEGLAAVLFWYEVSDTKYHCVKSTDLGVSEGNIRGKIASYDVPAIFTELVSVRLSLERIEGQDLH